METNSDNKTKIWLRLMKAGSKTGCHQLYERSFHISGCQFPVCARCTGLAAGDILGLILGFVHINWNIRIVVGLAALFLTLLAIDGIGQLYGKWVSNNLRRFLTGITCGFFITAVVIRLLKVLFF